MILVFLYARVSSREQEREGYSIPAQRKLLAEYARTHNFHIEREFVDVESAKNPGRKEFSKMLRLLEADGACRIVLVEKTDRLYRNRTDALAFEALIEKRGVEIYLVKEARVIGKDSRSQDKFMHDNSAEEESWSRITVNKPLSLRVTLRMLLRHLQN